MGDLPLKELEPRDYQGYLINIGDEVIVSCNNTRLLRTCQVIDMKQEIHTLKFPNQTKSEKVLEYEFQILDENGNTWWITSGQHMIVVNPTLDPIKVSMYEDIPDPETRWEQGLPNNPKSISLARHIGMIDYIYNNDKLNLKFGGDGDLGEDLIYILDMIFERQNKIKEYENSY